MNVVAIIIIGALLLVALVVVLAVWLQARKKLREAKNYERGLKMVPMLIHLPPSSEDIDGGSRDSRDVTEEAISKAETLYDIIASTATKGFKSKLYGQRHISFEIVAVKGLVHYYVAAPVTLVPVVQQAIISAYPSARLEEVSEHNIFSPVGKISGTIGGELSLKEDYINPIATFRESKRDAMQSLLNALSTLGTEDGAGVQIMLRPAHGGWSKRSTDYVSKKKKEKGGGFVFKDILSAFWKAPENKDGSSDEKQLSNLEQSQLDAIEEKTRHSAYEVMVRIIASSNTAQGSQAVLNNLAATFALFDAPGKNGFKYSEAKDIESFVTAYIMRFFPPELHSNVLNSVELATIFHFPDQSHTPTSQVERQLSKQVDGPRNVPEQGLLLGYNVFRGIKKEIRLSDDDRRRHLYIVGQTGTGKTVLLENLALQDMLSGKGFAFIDPHGDAVERLITMVPKERTEDIVYFSPGEMDYPMGLNLFEFQTEDQKDFLVQEAINMLYKLYDPQHQGIIGPRYEHWFRNASLTLMSDPGGSTFIDIPKVFTDNQYAKQKLQYVKDQTVREFWTKEMAQTADFHKSEVLGWFVSKFSAFLNNQMMRNVIGQTKSAFNLREVMDEGKILFVNLAKGRTGELNSKLLGMIFVMKFQAAAMSRTDQPEEKRRDFSLYVDEFQNFSTDSFATILSEARKYRLNLIVANQFIGQLTEEVRDAVFGNVGSVLSLRAGATDADFLVKQFSPVFDTEDIVKLPNYNAVVRLMIGGVPSQPFSMATIPPLGHTNSELGSALKRLSSAKYGRPRKVVEDEIFKRLETKEPPRPRFDVRPGTGQPKTGGMARRPAAPGGGQTSFLDEWLEKRRKQMAQKPQEDSKPPLIKPSTLPSKKPLTPSQKSDEDQKPPAKHPKIKKHKVSHAAKSKPTTKPKSDEKTDPNKQVEDASAKLKQAANKEAESSEDFTESDDEIYIDKDGNLHYKSEEK